MRLVNWNSVLPANAHATVLFSALALPPHRDTIDANLVAIQLPNDLFVDVEWVRKIGKYIVTLYRDDIENVIAERRCNSAFTVIDDVCELIRAAGSTSIVSVPISESYDSVDVCLSCRGWQLKRESASA